MSRVLVDSGVSWLGKIPDSWSTCRVKNKFLFHKIIAKEKSVNYDRIALTLNGVIKRDKDDSSGLQPDNYNGYQIVYKDDLIFKLIDLENVNTSRIGKSEYEGITSPAYIVLTDKCNTRYSLYYFLNMWYQEIFNNIGGDGVRSAINKDDLLKVPFINAPIDEQNKIADYLDKQCKKINEIINDNNHEIELLEEYKISIIENTVKNYNKDCSLRNIDWITSCDKNVELIKLKYNSIISTGTTPKDFEKNETSNKIDWFTPSDFKSIVLNNSVRKLDIDLVAENKMFPKNTTLIIGIGGTLGKVGITQDKCYSNQQITALIGNNKIIPKYLTYNLLSAQKYIKDTCPYTTLPILSNSYLKNIFICIRSKEEQEKIVEYLDNQILKIDEVIDYRKKIIEKLEEYKRSLIYECVTGKREV